MTDSHCHVAKGAERYFVCSAPDDLARGDGVCNFYGYHPWFLEGCSREKLAAALAEDPHAGVGEIGLDRLRERQISQEMRAAFRAQLETAAAFSRPVVLHGAKCWGEVVREIKSFASRIPAFLFHGFSRSGGLIDEIASLGGFISVGLALLNDHAVNYRALAKLIPLDILLVESDRTAERADETPPVSDVARKLAELRDIPLPELEILLENNAGRFTSALK